MTRPTLDDAETTASFDCSGRSPSAMVIAEDYDDGEDERIITNGDSDPEGANAADYASSVSLSRMLYGEDLLEWISRRRPGVTTERQSVGPVLFPPPGGPRERRITVVRAPMGSGKTTALIEWLLSALRGPHMRALVVSCRRSFTHTLARRFNDAGLVGFVTYFASADYIIRGRQFGRLLIQAESLHRVDRSLLDSYDVLVLDEVMSTIGQLYSPTMRCLRHVDDALTRLLRSCPRVLAMDATVNAQLVDSICELRGEDNVHVVIGEYAAPGFSNRRCTVMRSLGADMLTAVRNDSLPDEHGAAMEEEGSESDLAPLGRRHSRSFFSELGRRLRAGLNVCIFSSTLAFSEVVADFCRGLTDSVLLLNSDSPDPVDVATWSSYRAVVYTTVVTVGLSFDDAYFHSMFAYVKPTGHGPDMVSVYQSLGRVRSLIRNEVMIYVDGSSARCEIIFTPMLLNHVVARSRFGGNGGGWPASFQQVTNAACCAFRRDCVPAFREAGDSYLFRKFKYKHLFERCTLASLGDSINILHALLENNNIRVSFDGCGPEGALTAESFGSLLIDVRRDSLRSQRLIGKAREAFRCPVLPLPVNNLGGDILLEEGSFLKATEDDINEFKGKYLRPAVPQEDLTDILTRMRDPIFRERFVNAAVLEACLGTPFERRCDETLDSAYRLYGTGKMPYVTREGYVTTMDINEDFNLDSRRDAYRSCAIVAEALRWSPASDDPSAEADIDPQDIFAAVSDSAESLRRLLMEIPRCYATDKALATSKPARRVAAVLNGCARAPSGGYSGDKNYCVALFKVVWEEMFGAHVVKSTRTFPGSAKVKNLRKAELEKLLDDAGVSRDGLGTHKQLYAALMANKAAFSQRRYRIKRPKWYGWLKPSRDHTDPETWSPAPSPPHAPPPYGYVSSPVDTWCGRVENVSADLNPKFWR